MLFRSGNSKPDGTQRPGNDDPVAATKKRKTAGERTDIGHTRFRQATGMAQRDRDEPEGSATDLKGNERVEKCRIAVLKLV